MHALRLVAGLAAACGVVSVVSAGCGSSSSSNPGDAGSDVSEAACAPQMVSQADASAACTTCVAGMCGSQYVACTADCTCGGTINMLNACIAANPAVPLDAATEASGGGGLAGLIGGAGLGGILVGPGQCLVAALVAGGGGGVGGLLAAAGGDAGTAMTSATSAFVQCYIANCVGTCMMGAMPEGGMPEASPDGASDGAANEASSSDAASEASPGDGSSDAAGQ